MKPIVPLTDTDKMPFGKYKGELMEDVPASYLHWLWTEADFSSKVKTNSLAAYIEKNMHSLKEEYPDGIWR